MIKVLLLLVLVASFCTASLMDILEELVETEIAARGCTMVKVGTKKQFNGNEVTVAERGYSLQACKQKCMDTKDCYGIDVKHNYTGACWMTTQSVGTVSKPNVRGDTRYDAWMKVCPETETSGYDPTASILSHYRKQDNDKYEREKEAYQKKYG